MSPLSLDTAHGPALAHLYPAPAPRAALMLGHGAGGGVATADLQAVTAIALELNVSVVLLEQPYRVAGRRAPAPAHQLDTAWTAALQQLVAGPLSALPLITGGRSSGGRVACRTAAETGAMAVLCLAFPLHPPRKPEQSRQAELDAVAVPVLVVQGTRDRFGMPVAATHREVVAVPGDHSLATDPAAVAAAVRRWITRHL